MINENLRINESKTGIEITMCGKGSCKCPSVEIDLIREDVVLGGKEEGFSTWTKEQFKLLATEIKGGTFDKYLKD
jgi:hypothetical protein